MAYSGSIPGIQKAYENDPRLRLAQSALATGTGTGPVAQGGWAVTDGLARAAQAIAGAFMQKKLDKKYQGREEEYTKAMQAAAALAGQQQPSPGNNPNGEPPLMAMPPINPATLNPATANPGTDPMAAAAMGLAGQRPPPMPAQGFDPGASTAPQAPQMAPPPAMMPQAPAFAPQAPSPPAAGRIPAVGSGAAAVRPLSAKALYRGGIVPIEGGTRADGSFLTSPKGAIGPGQVMPGTAREAAKLAGLPYDDNKYRSDPEYNNALGEAYYTEQLRKFGDPVMAAAAYNAGPGGVQRAIRKARVRGGTWEDHLPDETKGYVRSFREKIGGSQTTNEDVAGVGAVPVAPPTMEAVPERPVAPATAQPGAPNLPPEVQSSRIAMAQQLLQSGNPDVVALAQSYLDKGLDEQFTARTNRSQNEFQQGQTGYDSALSDWRGARTDDRQDQYTRGREAESRNFTRETGFTDRTFTAGENAAQREQAARLASADSADRRWSTEYSEEQANRRNNASIAGRAQTTAERRNVYLNTPTGLKMQDKLNTEIEANDKTTQQFQRFLDLNEKQKTGGLAIGNPLTGPVYQLYDNELREMNSIASKTTLGEIGGSLGVAISDGDRKFISESNISVNSPKRANQNVARAAMGGLRRKNDYLREFQNAQIDGTQGEFYKEWKTFTDSVPIVQYNKRGQAVVNDKPITFKEWRDSRPKYDALGNRVN